MLGSLGKVTVTTAGTPVQIVTTTLNCNSVFFSTIAGQSGQQMYIGLKNMVKSTLVGVLHILEKSITTPAFLDHWAIVCGVGQSPIDLSTIWIDADTSADSLLISYLSL